MNAVHRVHINGMLIPVVTSAALADADATVPVAVVIAVDVVPLAAPNAVAVTAEVVATVASAATVILAEASATAVDAITIVLATSSLTHPPLPLTPTPKPPCTSPSFTAPSPLTTPLQSAHTIHVVLATPSPSHPFPMTTLGSRWKYRLNATHPDLASQADAQSGGQ
ncbi:hypothetical protein B0A48_17755 [Cryoendolithus antarcticus]|uniref:Uncharacterized protein n=1 Tax=Cryoendolithus antarcticus TaxID=1507870 RepID=A0A1V8S9N4_9PEZI|nr:hypothetical protein B0A48_17755 [Cryoendolithus antarcticus]